MAPPPPRARRFTLQGRTFAFHGVAPQSRQQWTRVLEARGATVRADWRGHAAAADAAAQVFVLTDWWVDSLPRASRDAGNAVCVTEFWLRESLKNGGWLALDAHPFFTPPAAISSSAPLLLSYPMDYDDGALAPATTTTTTTLARLPCSPLNLYEDVVPLWPYIVTYLRNPMTTTAEFAAVQKLITGEARHPLNCLKAAIDELLSPADRKAFFRSVLPAMKQLVLDLPFTLRKSLQLLPPLVSDSARSSNPGSTSLRDKSVHLTRAQLLPLLSAMFLSVFPAQAHIPNVEFPWFSMERMFSAPRSMPDFVLLKAHKIRTILEYFLRVVPRYLQAPDELEHEIVTFTRVALCTPSALTDPASLLQSLAVGPTTTGRVSDVRIETNSLIEDLEAHLQIDFANKYAGGGVMNGGAVQEEIRFVLSPELMVSCLVFARLEANESFVIHGSERFSNYTGYGGTFRFAGSVQDATPFETVVVDPQTQQPQRRRQSVVVGIDAISYGGNNVNRQYSRRSVMRELTKALVGFAYPNPTTTAWPIATGNWGCGVFRGDPELKFLIQWVAASLAGRSMVYVIFEQTSDLQDKVTGLLSECTRVVGTQPQQFPQKLLAWILEFLLELESEVIGHADRMGRVRSSTRNEGPRRQDQRMRAEVARRRPSETVLERATAFIRGKLIPTSTTTASSDTSAPTGLASTSLPTTSPAHDTPAGLTEAPQTPTPTRTPVTTPHHRTSGSANGSGGGPQLKQPKLTSFWK